MESLKMGDLWPLPARKKSDQCLRDALNRLRDLKAPLFETTAEHSCSTCEALPHINHREDCRDARDLLLDIKQGICLDCVKTGRKSRSDGGCRVEHDDEYLFYHL